MASKTNDETSPGSEANLARSDSPLFSGWVELNAIENSKVVFLGVKELYSSSQDLQVFFRFISGNEYNEGDIINLTRVGEENLNKPRCSLDPKHAEDDIGKQKKLVIQGENLPKRTEFYQFLYVRDSVVIGASSPFYLHTSGDDVLAVSSEDDFLVVHQVEMGEEVQVKCPPQTLVVNGQQQKEVPRSDEAKGAESVVMEKTETCDTSCGPSSPSDSSSVTSTETECSSCASDELSKEKDLGNEEKDSSVKTTKKLSKYWKRRWYNREMVKSKVAENPSSSEVQNASKISGEASKLDLSAIPSTSKEEKRDSVSQPFGTLNNDKYAEILQKMHAQMRIDIPNIIMGGTRPEPLVTEQDQAVSAMKFVLERTTRKYELERKQRELQVEANKTLMAEIKEQDEKLKSLDIELQKVKRSRETSMKEVLTLSCAKNLLEMELKEKVEKIKILEKTLEDECKTKDLSKKNSEQIENLMAENQRLESTVASQKTEVSKIQEELADENRLNQIMKEQVWNLTRENEMIQKQCERKVSSDSDVQDMLLAMVASKSIAVEEIKSLQIEQEKLSELLRDMTSEREELYAKIEELKQDILLLKNQEVTLKEDHENMKSKLSEMEKESSNAKSQIGDENMPVISIEDMQQNLAEAAELYRKQFMEILSLRKLVKKLEKRPEACKRCNKDDQMSNQSDSTGIHCTELDEIFQSVYETEARQSSSYVFKTGNDQPSTSSKTSDDVQFVARIQKSDSDTGEFIKVVEPRVKEDNGSSIQIISMDSLTSGIVSAGNALERAAADLYQSELASAPTAETVSIPTPALSKTLVPFEEVPSASSFIDFSQNTGDDVTKVGRKKHSRVNSIVSEKISFVSCHHCGLEIPTDGDDLTQLVEHLHESHNQYICPVCGISYDGTLPIDYYKMHVESHFSD